MTYKDHEFNWMSKHSLAEKHFDSVQNLKIDKRRVGDSEVCEGKKLFSEGRTAEAKQYIIVLKRRFFEKAIQLNPDNCDALYLLGVSDFSMNDFQEAVVSFTTLIKKNPSHKKHAYILMAIIYKKSNDFDSSLSIVIYTQSIHI
jgi:tetratricopeptide (TPR) repeat protein